MRFWRLTAMKLAMLFLLSATTNRSIFPNACLHCASANKRKICISVGFPKTDRWNENSWRIAFGAVALFSTYRVENFQGPVNYHSLILSLRVAKVGKSCQGPALVSLIYCWIWPLRSVVICNRWDNFRTHHVAGC